MDAPFVNQLSEQSAVIARYFLSNDDGAPIVYSYNDVCQLCDEIIALQINGEATRTANRLRSLVDTIAGVSLNANERGVIGDKVELLMSLMLAIIAEDDEIQKISGSVAFLQQFNELILELGYYRYRTLNHAHLDSLDFPGVYPPITPGNRAYLDRTHEMFNIRYAQDPSRGEDDDEMQIEEGVQHADPGLGSAA